jgi:transposase
MPPPSNSFSGVKCTQGKLRLFYLPSYSTELNADGLVWNHVKSHRLGHTVVKTKDQLRRMARSVLRSLQRNTELLRRFFLEPHVQYVFT